MKIRIDQNEQYPEEPEVIIRCRRADEGINKIVSTLELHRRTLLGTYEGNEYAIELKKILYCESVDGIVYIYTKEYLYKSAYTLYELENRLKEFGFFRCSKSMVVNINSISRLKSELGNRIDALLTNEEHIIVSRKYARALRSLLKEVSEL